jgi:hypothetical protein
MKLNEENIKNILTEYGNWSEKENLFFIAMAIEHINPVIGAPYIASYLVNKTEAGISIIPVDPTNHKPKYELAKALPNEEISSVEFGKGMVMGQVGVTITTTAEEIIFFSAPRKAWNSKFQKPNFAKFMEFYKA